MSVFMYLYKLIISDIYIYETFLLKYEKLYYKYETENVLGKHIYNTEGITGH